MAVVMLTGCQTTNTIDLASYAPVIDLKGQGQDEAIYWQDLHECRELGQKVQKTYQEQRKKEQEQALATAFIGALAGAAIGDTVGRRNNVHTGNTATAVALTGLTVGAQLGADQVDYSRLLAKFGPTAVVDRCLAGRGYKILSNEGLGGG